MLCECAGQRGLIDESQPAAAPHGGKPAAAVQLEMVRFSAVRRVQSLWNFDHRSTGEGNTGTSHGKAGSV